MNNKMTKFFFGLFLLLSFTLLAKTQNTVIRAAIDIGMGGPKLQIAEVDLTTHKIVKMLHTQRYFVNFYESISQSDDHQLCPEIRAQGLRAFKEAVGMAHSFKVDGIVAIATAAFRSATNGIEFAHEIQKETGVKVYVIDQNLEGELAFQAVLARMDVQADDLIVWDIGGGSIQFIGTAFDGSYFVDCGKEGAGIFKDFIIENIQQRNVKEFLSPNPMSAEDITQATLYAQNLSQHVDEIFKNKIKCSTTTIVGAGSVFGYGIASMVSGKNPFSIHDLTQVVQDLIGKTDADLGGGEFAFCEGSNSILALGFMQGLGIQQMHIINVNNADGAMIYAPFWKQHK